jgi:hypothetical protein
MSFRWAPLGVLLPLAVLVGFAATPSGAAPAATPGGANPYVSQSGSPLPAPAQVAAGSAQKLGAADPSQQLRLVIGLKPPHPAEEEAFIQSLQDKNSPNFHKYLTADEWNARFGPSAQSEADVVNWATRNGLTVTQRYGNHLVVDVQGSVATVQKAFGVQINNYRLGSKSFYSNARSAALPASLAGVVSSVQGMNSLQALVPSSPQAQQQAYPAFSAGPARATGGAGHANGSASGLAAAKAASAKKLGSSGRATGGATGGGVTPGLTNGFYDPTDLYSSQAYDVNALYGQGHCCNPTHNPGVTPPATSIAIATAGSHNGSDFTGFHNQYPYLADHWQEFFIDGTPTCCDFEGTMDFEWSTAMSNSFGSYVDTSMVYMYDGANNLLSTFTDIWNQMLSDGVARTMSTSWGCAESFCYDSGTISTDHNIFNSMLGQGWTLIGISHDHGPYADCAHVSDSYPGSDPDLVSSGGTALQAAGVFSSETAWTGGSSPGSCASNNGGGGGGCSATFGKPGWQGVATMCSTRAEPDMSLNAAIGQNVFFGGSLTASGGTSIVAPELAGIFAQINAYVQALGNACGTGSPCPTIGDPHWAMYDANSGSPHHPYYDITSGCTSNDIGAGWCAGPGYDLATGLGSANLFQFAWSILWFSVPELTPPTVTITGPTTGAWYNGGTLNWTVVDSGGSFPPTGVAGYTYTWDADPGDPTSEPHGGSGNSFYNGPAVKNSTSGSISLAAAGVGCHTLYVRAWDNIGDSSVRSYGTVCYDPTAPTITSAPNEKFVIGKLGAGSTAPVRTSWAASDSLSGVQGYYVYRRVDLGAWTLLGFQGANSVTQYLAAGHHYQYGIYALDHAGNLSAFSMSSNFGLNLVQETAPSIAYSTGWTLQALPGASGGKVKFSTAAGKTAKFTYVGSRLALVTTKSPSRGSASVTPSGSGTVVVNAHAATQTTAYLAFAGAYANGAHTLLIKNLGSNTPRFDVDAFFYIGT